MKVLVLLPFIFLVSSLSAQQPVLEPDLEKILLSNQPGEMVRIIVGFRNPSQRENSSESPAWTQRNKMRQSLEAQSGVLALVKSQPTGILQKEQMKSLWINNSIILTASKDFIYQLARREEIQRIRLDREITLFDPTDLKPQDADSKSLTYGLEKIRARQVWNGLGLDGTGVVVGVLDSGVDLHHPVFGDRVLKTRDFISDYPDNQANDGLGHGTHCSGTILGQGHADKAIGVAPGAGLYMAKIFNDQGRTRISAILSAMQWMADPDEDPDTADFPRVISNSWGGGTDDTYQEAVNTWTELGIIPVFAAGNSGPLEGSVAAPARYKNVIAVGATDAEDRVARFSARGPVNYQGEPYIKPDISAPGVDIDSAKPGGTYKSMSGTSMAAPPVVGVIALMLQADPSISLDKVREILADSAVDLGDPGKDNLYGFGRLDAFQALGLQLGGGKIKLNIDSGNHLAAIRVNPGNRTYYANSLGEVEMSLPRGDYELRVSAFGFFAKFLSIRVEAGKTLNIHTALQTAPFFRTIFDIKNFEGLSLDASITFQDVPVQGGNTTDGLFEVDLPGGDYKVRIESKGHRVMVRELYISSASTISIRVPPLPPFLIVDRDMGRDYERYYQASLNALGVEFDSTETPTLEETLGYTYVIWFTGKNNNSSLLDGDAQELLEAYVKSGGRLIISGQEIGYRIRVSRLYQKVLGATFLEDISRVKSIEGSGLRFNLDGGDGADNQRWPDVIKINPGAAQTARAFLHYKNRGPAGIFNTFGLGKVIYLPFGFEGVDLKRNRNALMSMMFNLVKVSLKDQLDRIALVFRSRPSLYRRLIDQLSLRKSDSTEILQYLNQVESKAPFRFLLKDLQENSF